jgi:beta-N-acetylhexosaminidase
LKFITLILLIFITFLSANEKPSDIQLKKMIGRMIIIGFDNEKVDKNSKIIKNINKYNLGGVILFDRFYNDRNKTKNIRSPKQLKELTSSLKRLSNQPLLISVDQEGGRVARLKPSYGFSEIPSAAKVSKLSTAHAKKIYTKMAKMLKNEGINTNFAPVVDLAVNPKNTVIVGLERSFGKSSKKVSEYAKILIDAQKDEGIISVLKHFPGHGSSLGDSHKGFVDVTNTWSEAELEPYKTLIKLENVDMIMTAHVFNAHLDKKYPATLSYNVNTKLLRNKLHFKGVIVSDDMQMKAISAHYTLEQTVTLAINAGVDMLLFGNQLGVQNVDEVVNVIFTQVKNGKIPHAKIIEANKKIEKLFQKIE